MILTAGAQLRLGVVAGLEVRSGPGSQRPEPIGLGAGLVTADPAVVFDPPQTITREPTLGAVFGPARIGETVVVDVVAPSATSVTWLVAPLAQRRIEAGVTGAIWFDPAIADGLALTSGPATRINIPIPANETLRGAVLLVQGVATSGPTAASVPATVVIR